LPGTCFPRGNLVKELKLSKASGRLNRLIPLMLLDETIEYTLPEKPNSRLQKYRITAKGRKVLKTKRIFPS
jgi:ATP-dependent DNA helicase RecG